MWFSCSLDDHDSCLFVAGVERFNIQEHRPHPPGYPIYILGGKALNGLLGSPALALSWLSIISSGIAAMLLPRLFRRLGAPSHIALVQAAVVIATPCFWLTGSKILTDMPGFALTLILWLAHLQNPEPVNWRRAFWLGVGVGLACGVRTHLFLPLLPFLLRGPAWVRLAGVALGFTAWYGGMALHQGIDQIIAATEQQAMMRFHERNVSIFVGDGVWRRAARFARALAEGTLGLQPWRATIFIVAAGCMVALVRWRIWMIRSGATIKSQMLSAKGLIVIAAVVKLAFVFTFLPAHPRYFLCVLPALAIVLTFNRAWIGIALVLVMGTYTAQRAKLLHTVAPAPFQAIEHMNQLDPDKKVPLLASKLFAYAREGSPERVRSRISFDLQATPPPTAFFTDRWTIPDHLPRHRLVSSTLFDRDESVHDKDHRVRLRFFEPVINDTVEVSPPR